MKACLSKVFTVMVLLLSGTLLTVSTAHAALTWYWGGNPGQTYEASYPTGTDWVWLPITVTGDGDSLVGAGSAPPLLNGMQQWDTAGYGIGLNLSLPLTVPSPTSLSTGLYLRGFDTASGSNPYGLLAEGVYTPDPNWRVQLNYFAAGTTSPLVPAYALNAYEITVGQPLIAVDKYWVGESGRWDVGPNWNPLGEPAKGDAIHLETSDNLARIVTYATTLADPTFSSLRIDATNEGSIILQQSQDSLGVAGGYTEIGWAGQGTFEQDGGTSVFETVIVGSKAGSDGSVILSGGTTTINRLVVAEQTGSTGNLEIHTDGDLTVATDAVIGEGGNGTFVQDGGTSAITTMIVGAKSGGTGSVSLSGGTTTINRLVVAENTGSSGSVAVSGTGALTVNTDVVIGQGGNGSFSLSGGSLKVDGWGTIGVSNTGSFSQTDGTSAFSRVVLGLTSTGVGTFDLTGGTSTIGELVLGHDVGSQGTFNLSGTGNLVVSGAATIGSGSVGVYNQSGGKADVGTYLFVGRAPTGEGTVNLSGGSLSADYLTVGHDVGAQGTVNLSGTGSLMVDGPIIGLAGTGVLTQSGGSLTATGNLHLGQVASGRGEYRLVDGTSSIGGDVYVGMGPDSVGSFFVEGGSATVGGNIAVALVDGSGGSLVIDGGSLSVTGAVGIGAQGSGVAEQTAGDLIVGTNLTLGVQTSTALGYYTIFDGTISVGEQLQVGSVGEGSFDQRGGSAGAKTVLIGGTDARGIYVLKGGELTAGLNINVGNGDRGWGSFDQLAGSVTARDYLNLGVSADSQGFYFLEGGELTVGDSGSAIGIEGYGLFSHGVGTHTTTGNLIVGSAVSGEGLYVIGTGGALSSTGQFIGNYGTGSFIQSGGSNLASADLVLGRNASGVGSYDLRDGQLSVRGDAFVGALGSGWMKQSGGEHEVGNNLVIGANAGGVGTYVQSGGTLDVGGGIKVGERGRGTYTLLDGFVTAKSMTIGDSSGSVGTVNHFGGSLVVDDVVTIGAASGRGTYILLGSTLTAEEVQVGSNGRLLGIGTVDATVVNNGGFIGPGLSPGRLGIAGDLLFYTGVLEIEIAGLGLDPLQFDVLNISGNADFRAGTILFSFIGGFLPKEGDIIPFLTASALDISQDVEFSYLGAAPGFLFDLSFTDGKWLFKALNDAVAVSEPASLALIAMGLVGLGAIRRKKLAA